MTLSPVDFKQIAYFVQVAELGGFTRAARVLRVAQPALSRQVRLLEVELRQPLFDRHGRGVTLTDAGKRLLAHGRGILLQVQRARQDLEEQRGAPVGVLTFGMPPSVGRSVIAPLVGAFRSRFPQATPSIVEGLSSELLDRLLQGRIDCALVYDVAPRAAVLMQPVLQQPLFLMSARQGDARTAASLRGRPIPLRTLAGLPLVIPSRPNSIRMLLESALARIGCMPRIGLEIESVPAILELVRLHPLHAVLALNALRGSGLEHAVVARPIVRPALAATLSIATAAQRPGGPLLDQSVALLHERLPGWLGVDDEESAAPGSNGMATGGRRSI